MKITSLSNALRFSAMRNEMRTNHGFSLIEVMIALLVLAIGLLGISKLQSVLIQSGSDANQRAAALSLAQMKIDDLKSFIHLDKPDHNNDGVPDDWAPALSAGLQSFSYIETNKGGAADIQYSDFNRKELVQSSFESPITFQNYEYALSWEVEDYYYSDPINNSTAITPVPIDEDTDFKLLTVNVQWQEPTGDTEEISLETVIEAYSPLTTASSSISNVGGDAPIIPYTPEAAPDVIAIDLDENTKKETSKPLPDVSKKGFSTLTSFESVTYNTNLDTVTREDFRTVSCRCGEGSSTVNTHLYGRTVWDEQNLRLKDEIYTVDEPVVLNEVDDGGGESQAFECNTCCRDAPDPVDGIFKNCRLKRVDGVLRYFDPWKMIAFTIAPASYFDVNGIDAYSNAVQSLVRQRAGLDAVTFDAQEPDTNIITLSEADREIVSNPQQLQVRAVYMDPAAEGIFDDCGNEQEQCTTENVPLNRLSFNEVNVTNLAGWMPDKDQNIDYSIESDAAEYITHHDAIKTSDCSSQENAPTRAYVTNDELVNGCETGLSRGMFYSDNSQANQVQSVIYTSNDGLVNRNTNNEPTVFTEIEMLSPQ